MRGMWKGIGFLTLLLGVGGCTTTDANLRPTKGPDELVEAPDDKRYQEPPVPPKSSSPDDGLPKQGPQPGNGMPHSPTKPGTPGGPSSAATGY